MKQFNFHLKALLCLALAAGILCSCKKDNTDSEPEPPVKEYLTLEQDTVYFMSTAATDRIVAVSASDNSWIAETDEQGWCSIKTAKNSLGEKELKVSVQENADTLERKCNITLTIGEISGTLTVVQMGAVIDDAYKIIPEKQEYSLEYTGGALVIPVVADGEFEAATASEWIAFDSKSVAENGQTMVGFSVQKNPSEEPRSAEIEFKSLRTSAVVSVTQKGYTPLAIEHDAYKVSFLQDTVSVKIISVEDYTIQIEDGKRWLMLVENEDEQQDSIARFAVEANPYKLDRSAVVTVKSNSSSATFTITQIALKEYPTPTDDEQPDDILVPIVSASVSSFRSTTNNADKLYDGSFNTFWATSSSPEEANPEVVAEFDSEASNTIDYIAITHTNRVQWGQLGKIEIYATDRKGAETLVTTADCGMSNNGTSRIKFEPVLTDVAKIRIKVISSKSASSYPNAIPACAAEIRFFAYNPDKFDPLSVFTDSSCSVLKEGITLEDIDNIKSDFYKNIAEQIYMGLYSEFRVCVAKPYPHPDRDADIHLTKPMGTLLDNVTGMYFPTAGVEHIILVGDTHGQKVQMRVIDWVNHGNYGSLATSPADYTLTEGRNKIKVNHAGMIYILYHTDDYASLQPVTINFPTASVNGYFDITKHSLDDFKEIFEQASAAEQRNFDMLTDDCLLCFPKEAYKSATLLNSYKNLSRVKDMLMIFDTVFKIEEELQGLKKYQALGLQREWRNKGPFYGDYGGGYGYSGWYVTGYGVGNMAMDLLNPSRMWNKTATKYNNGMVGSVWGLAHELGHSTQTINFEWRGLSEVTNNLNCAVVQDKFFGLGNTTMWFNDHFNRGMRDIVTRLVTDIDGKQRPITHCESVNTPSAGGVEGGVDPTTQLMPFWQLYLYYHHVVGNTDFYPDFYELCRLAGNWTRTDDNNKKSMLEYIKRVSDAAKEDLSDFCKAWGLPGVNNKMKVNHYGQNYVTTTQAELNEMYAYCSKYPKPKLNPLYINDKNVDMFRNPTAVTAGTHTYGDGGRYTMSGWSGVVAWELVDPETGRTICIHTNDLSFTFAEYPSIYIANSTGDDYVYSNSNNTNRALQSVSPVYYPNALVYGVAADGTKTASLSNTK